MRRQLCSECYELAADPTVLALEGDGLGVEIDDDFLRVHPITESPAWRWGSRGLSRQLTDRGRRCCGVDENPPCIRPLGRTAMADPFPVQAWTSTHAQLISSAGDPSLLARHVTAQ